MIGKLARNRCEDWFIEEHAFSGSDDTDLVGFADNVFVGRVEERVGSSGPGGPEPWGSARRTTPRSSPDKRSCSSPVTTGGAGGTRSSRRATGTYASTTGGA
jgi:hypothetical protein